MISIDQKAILRALLLVGLALPVGARADYCPFPPADAMSNDKYGTFDSEYVGSMCNNWVELWNGLNGEAQDWDQGYGLVPLNSGWTATCAVDHFLSRLLNAAYLIRDVSEHSGPFGLHRFVVDSDGDLAPGEVDSAGNFLGDWWSFTRNHNGTDWEPSCGNTNVRATNYQPPLTHIALHASGAYRLTALQRASTVVHETVHEDVGHVGDSACSGGGSCDRRYGDYNAQTMDIDFLHDAVTRYRLGYVNNQLVRIAAVWEPKIIPGLRICSYDPVYSQNERQSALTMANNKRTTRFQFFPVAFTPEWTSPATVDAVFDPIWNCDHCDLSDWTFDANTCSQTACNELLNPENEDRNEHNAGQCFLYNWAVAIGGSSQEAISEAKADYPFQACEAPSESAARSYCDAEKASATHVDDIDSCGWMEGLHFPSVSKARCVQEFCHERFEADFQANGAVAWGPSTDPYGCLEAICAPDGENCAEDLPEAQCKQVFLAAHGHPDYYAGSCIADRCERRRASCLADILADDPTAWEYPAEVPAECEDKLAMCQLISWIAADIFLSLNDFPALAWQGLDPEIQSINPAAFLPAWIQDYQMQMTSGTSPDGRARAARRLTSRPEMVAGLFNLAPERFVALFGSQGFEELIGPVIHQIQPRAIQPQDLTPRGQESLAHLEEMIAGLPPEERVSAFGTLHSQAQQLDLDGDGISGSADNCPRWSNPAQGDVDQNGTGDDCECGDQSGDGTVNVTDIVAINRVIFGSEPASALCDANGDGLCNVSDMVAVNRRIFGGSASCARSPAAAP